MGASMYAAALLLFFPFRQSFVHVYTVVLCMYFVSFAMGYAISTAVPLKSISMMGIGFALLWALVLSGVVISLDDVLTYDGHVGYSPAVQWLWSISAPRWGIEAFWIQEVQARPFLEKNFPARHQYDFGNYYIDLHYMLLIAVGWNILSFIFMKSLNRQHMK